MFSGQHFAILAMFCVERLSDLLVLSGGMTFCVERLHDFSHSLTQGEVVLFFSLRGCVILCVDRLRDFLLKKLRDFSHSLRLLDLFLWRLRDFFFVERLPDFFWRDCLIFF